MSSSHTALVPFDDLALEGDVNGDLELEGDESGGLTLGVNAAVYTEGSPQIPQSEDPAYFPYITFSFPATGSLADKDQGGGDHTVQVDVWHRTTSELAIKPLAAAVYNALHRQAMPDLPGHLQTECESMAFDVAPDGRTHRALIEFRVTQRG